MKQDEIARIDRIDREAAKHGMTYGQYVAEIERSKKVKVLPKDKIEQVEKLHAEGKSREEISAETGVSKTSVHRIINGERSSEVEPQKQGRKPKPNIPLFLITQAVEMLERSEVDCKEVGAAVGMLTAARLILEGES